MNIGKAQSAAKEANQHANAAWRLIQDSLAAGEPGHRSNTHPATGPVLIMSSGNWHPSAGGAADVSLVTEHLAGAGSDLKSASDRLFRAADVTKGLTVQPFDIIDPGHEAIQRYETYRRDLHQVFLNLGGDSLSQSAKVLDHVDKVEHGQQVAVAAIRQGK